MAKKSEEHVPEISSIRFVPMTENNGFVGFVSFVYDRLLFKSVSVWRKKDNNGFRLDYPEDPKYKRKYIQPIDKETTDLIEADVNAYLLTLKTGVGK